MTDLISEPPFPLAAAASKLRDELNAEWAALSAKQQKLADDTTTLNEVPAIAHDGKHIDRMRKVRSALNDVLRGQLRTLSRFVEEWPAAYRQCAVPAAEAATAHHDKVVAEIHEGLRTLGFPNPEFGFSAFRLVGSHPAVMKAKVKLEETRIWLAPVSTVGAERQIEKLTEMIRRGTQAAVAAVAA